MLSFKSYLTESLDVKQLKHLEHAEDHIIHGGHEGVAHAHDTLADVAAFLSGKKSKTRITQKYDGAPSIVFGINPENGKFFVATKAAFNKTPKLAYNAKDVEELYGHAPGLASKLNLALKELKKIIPKEGGVYQGDFMYDKSDLSDDEEKSVYDFTPNTITYSADKNSAAGRRVANSSMGLVVHTKYSGKTIATMEAGFDVDQSKFQKDPSVNLISPELTNPGSFPQINKRQYEKSMQEAAELMEDIHHDTLDKVKLQDILIKTHINQHVRSGTQISVKSYIKFLEDKMKKDMDSVKTEAAKQKKQEYYQERIDAVKKDQSEFEKVFRLHGLVQKAKDALVSGLAQTPGEFQTSIGGKPVKPEGFVAIRNGRPTKLVDRAEFSAANFAQGAFQKKGKPEGDEDTVGVPPDENLKKKVFTFGRMNPPTIGHRKLSDRVQEIAREHGADHEIVLSRTHDDEKNPLSPEQKEKHAKRVLGSTAKIRIADQKAPNVIDQVKRIASEGIEHLIMVVGSDRVEQMKQLLDSYNGKEFNFKKIDVVSAGARDPDSEDESEAASGTSQRGHAMAGRFGNFAKGLPKDVKPEHAQELYNDVRAAMDVKIDQNTNGIALARYAKRKDKVGEAARREQQRRLKVKETEKAAKQRAKVASKAIKKVAVIKKKPIKEDVMTTGDVRGLGFVSGNPGNTDDDFIKTWTAINAADADTRDNILQNMKKEIHDQHHNIIQQKQQAQKTNFIQNVLFSIKDKNVVN